MKLQARLVECTVKKAEKGCIASIDVACFMCFPLLNVKVSIVNILICWCKPTISHVYG
jgi:hypothetical protein